MFQNNLIAGASGQGGFYPYQIEQSLRFNDNDSAHLSRTPASAGNQRTFTLSMWVKRANLTSSNYIFTQGITSGFSTWFAINNDHVNFGSIDPTGNFYYNNAATAAKLRDPSAWYHIVLQVDTTQATNTDRVKIYVNGVEQALVGGNSVGIGSGTGSNTIYPAQNTALAWNRAAVHYICRISSSYPDVYLAEVHLLDGTAIDATNFGEFKSGIWVPKAYSGSYGTNGFYLSFADSAAIGDDLSGNGNDWTPSGLASTDVLLDSPTNNYAVLNNLVGFYNNLMTYLDGNLRFTQPASVGNAAQMNNQGTIGMVSGKWYWEASALDNNACGFSLGMDESGSHFPAVYARYSQGGTFDGTGCTLPSAGATYTSSDTIGLAFDADAGTLAFYKNNVLQGTVTNILVGNVYFPRTWINASTASGSGTFNFGQSAFAYTPPSGFLALNTANLPDPVIDPAQDDVPADYFNTVLYTGTGATQSITGVGFQPDWTWIKQRNAAQDHVLHDAVRGAGKYLISNSTAAEATNTNQLSSFDSDGFTVGTAISTNQSSSTYVAWNWKANGAGASNTDGSITSTVSVNQKAGFSIVSYTGNGTAGATVGHGLGVAPSLILPKIRSRSGDSWHCYHSAIGATQGILLNATNAASTDVGFWNNTGPTSSVITLGAYNTVSAQDYIAYCFAEVEGYSKFGSFVANGSTDGSFVYTNMRSRFVMLKCATASENWLIFDTARDSYNVAGNILFPNLSNAELSSPPRIDILSNGFKVRSASGAAPNSSGQTYIFAAFAESPFKYANAR